MCALERTSEFRDTFASACVFNCRLDNVRGVPRMTGHHGQRSRRRTWRSAQARARESRARRTFAADAIVLIRLRLFASSCSLIPPTISRLRVLTILTAICSDCFHEIYRRQTLVRLQDRGKITPTGCARCRSSTDGQDLAGLVECGGFRLRAQEKTFLNHCILSPSTQGPGRVRKCRSQNLPKGTLVDKVPGGHIGSGRHHAQIYHIVYQVSKPSTKGPRIAALPDPSRTPV